MSLDENTLIFVTESMELLEDMEDSLLALERSPNDVDLINRVFRAAHTIKGSAGLFGFEDIIGFTHVAENLLDDVRDCLVPVTADLISLLMRAKDHITFLIQGLSTGDVINKDEENTLIDLLGSYRAASDVMSKSSSDPIVSNTEQAAIENGDWHISVRLGSDTFREGFSPILMFDQLRELGEIINAQLITQSIPLLEELDPESCHLGWEITLRSSANKKQIADIFEFFDGATVHILPPESLADDYVELIDKLPEGNEALGQILVNIGALTSSELQQALKQQKQTGGLTGDILVEQGAVQQCVVEKALKKQQKARKENDRTFVRVDAEKLDKLVTLVGELVISGAKVAQLATERGDDELLESVEDMTLSMEVMRETALGLRMVPIATTFNRFTRVVRDLSKELNKHIKLEINGGETELDKTVVERIADPLTHLIRNSMDHGIESPKDRLLAGKQEEGLITLNAYHETGTIVIEVNDDGRGMDPERILNVARERGVVTDNQNLSEQEICNLIFEPGFSTAESVNNISGRGVGMDVVRRNIETLRGTVTLQSEKGKGSKVIIRLPLTLAIIDGFHISVANESFVIPLDMMDECVTLTEAQKIEVMSHNYINFRDEVLPIIRLSAYLELGNVQNDILQRMNVVVVQYAGKKIGLLVDELHGETQAVIKPLGRVFQGVQGFAGFTILGGGQVALIMDIADLVTSIESQEKTRHEHERRRAGGRYIRNEGISVH